MTSALDGKDQISAFDRKARLEWDIQDDEADNERADRDVSDRIVDRRERRGLTQRGQDKADSRGRRGQDLTDRRARDGVGSRRKPAVAPTATNPATGEKMVLDKGKWVPAK